MTHPIHLDTEPNILFGVLWRADDRRMCDLASHPVVKSWWANMADIIDTEARQGAGIHATRNRLSLK